MQDIGRLAALVAVAQHGSITKAAQRLGFTPAALSQQLTKLEREVRATLLIRHRGGSELTPSGTALLPFARQILELVDRARQEIAALQQTVTGQLQIGTFATGAVHLLPPVLTEFGRAYPQVDLVLREFEPPAGVTAVAEGVVDLTLTHEYEHGLREATPPMLQAEVLLREQLLLVLGSEATEDWGDGPLRLGDLAARPLISGARGLANREALEALFAGQGLPRPHVVFETADYAVACALSGSGMGVALVPEMAVAGGAAGVEVTLRSLTPPLHRTISMMWRSDDTSAALRALRLLLRDQLASPRAGDGSGDAASAGRPENIK